MSSLDLSIALGLFTFIIGMITLGLIIHEEHKKMLNEFEEKQKELIKQYGENNRFDK